MIFCQNNIAESITKASQTERNYIQKNESQFVWKIVKDFWHLPIIMSCYVTKTYLCLNSRNFWKNISHHYTQYSDELVNLINCGVLFKWEFFTQMRASCLLLHSTKKGNRERMGAKLANLIWMKLSPATAMMKRSWQKILTSFLAQMQWPWQLSDPNYDLQ